ncbi:hypothetical protein KWH43_22410, partial [Xanthomonas campestris pv. heliotropii]|nr:hypothetical protein [Xanthomonas campestris pv. heliotropii]
SVAWITPQHEAGSVAYLWCVVQSFLNATVGNLTVEYDGLNFNVTQVAGDVYINNTPAVTGMIVPGCCVLTFGNGRARKFVTFDVSNPEVMP